MKPVFRNLDDGPQVLIRFDGQEISLPEGANLAAALLAAGITRFRSTMVSGALRGPYCMMGACYDCLVELDGVTRQACQMRVEAGMDVRSGGADV